MPGCCIFASNEITKAMKIVLLSDTHSLHDRLDVPPGDLLLHAGDFSKRGTRAETAAFLDWFAGLPHPHKVLVAGNHDFIAERAPELLEQMMPESITYLNDSGATVNGIRIWGSPIQPWFFDWAFNRHPGPDIDRHWQLIPDDTDILITHGPPNGILDRTVKGKLAGCVDLRRHLKRIQPRLHVFGHIHEAYGTETHGKTTYINASCLNFRYQPVHVIQSFDW